MSGKLIATIYFYLISAGAIVLIVIGIFNTVSFFINSTQYEKYPLRYGGVSNCEYANDGLYYPGMMAPVTVPVKPAGVEIATPSAEAVQKSKEQCLKNEEVDRVQHRVEDMKNSLTFLVVGAVLFWIHFPQAKKRSA